MLSRNNKYDVLSRAMASIIYEPVHEKAYNKTSVTNKDSDQPVHPPSMTRVFIYCSLEAVESTCNQLRLGSVWMRRLI